MDTIYDWSEQHCADAVDSELYEIACDEILAMLPLNFD